jgi:phenylacetate-CoA ligase
MGLPVDATNLGRSYDWAYGALFRRVLMPLWEGKVRGRATLTHLQQLEQTQWLSREQLDELQTQSLVKLLTYAGENVPYYRELFRTARFDPRAVRSRADLVELPLLTRDIVRERYRDLIDPAHQGKNIKKGTSGSTGKPLKFEYSRESECWRQAIKLRGYGWAGYRPGNKAFFYWAAVSAGSPSWKMRLDRALKRETFFDSMKQDATARRAALEVLRRTRPEIIVCYTQACAQFARWIAENGLRDWDDIPVICAAEAVLPGDRAVLEQAFGPHIFESYGSRETMLIAAECEQHEGMHLCEENLLLEVVRDGQPVGPGESGEVVVTDLHNFGMPMIRYVNGDLALAGSERRCGCGRSLRRLARVDGRRADMMFDSAGNAVPGIVFHVLFSDARREIVRQFQAVQQVGGDVVLKVVRGRDFAEDAFSGVTTRFSEYLRGVPLRIEFHDAILPHQRSGKHQTIIVERAAPV